MQAIFIPCNQKDVSIILEMMDAFGRHVTIFRDHKPRKKRVLVFVRIPLYTDRLKLAAKVFMYDHRIGEAGQKPEELFK